jgi:hypothetical protein
LAAALHIDIYSIVLGNISLYGFIFAGLPMIVRRIKDEKLRKEMEKLFVWYSDTLAAGDWIVWPVILTAIYPLYILLALLFKGLSCRLIKSFYKDVVLLLTTTYALVVWLASTAFALLHWFLAYIIVFFIGLAAYVILRRKNKQTAM